MGRISTGERRGLKGRGRGECRGIKWGRAAIEAAEIAQTQLQISAQFQGR